MPIRFVFQANLNMSVIHHRSPLQPATTLQVGARRMRTISESDIPEDVEYLNAEITS